MPIVLLTSNNSRELTEALKRRCLYLWLDYPDARARARDRPPARARARRARSPAGWSRSSRMVRELDLKKPPSIAESIDWARDAAAARRRGHRPRDLRPRRCRIIVKHRTDLDLVAERVGVKLAERPGRSARRRRVSAASLTRPCAGPRARRRLAAQLLDFCEELRGEGVAVGTARDARRLRSALEQVAVDRARSTSARRSAATLAKSPGGPARLRAASSTASSSAPPRSPPSRRASREARRWAAAWTRPASELDLDELRRADRARRSPTATRARCATSRGWRSPPSAGRARAPAWSASTCSGSAARSACAPSAQPSRRRTTRERRRRSTATSIRRFERHLRRELERGLIERTETLPPARPLAELDRALPTSPTQDLAAVHRVVAQLKRRLATLGPRAARARSATRTSTCAGRCAPRWRPAACRSTCATGRERPRRPEIYVALRRLAPGHQRPASSSSRSCTRCTTRSASCAASSSSSGSAR